MTDPNPTHGFPRTQWRERLREFQRVVFCAFDFPRSSAAAVWVGRLIMLVVLVNTANVVAASFPMGLRQPAMCPDPVCTPDVPGAKCTKVVCSPEEKAAVLRVNAAVVAVLTVDYLARLLTIGAVPASVVHSEALAIDLDGNFIDSVRQRERVVG